MATRGSSSSMHGVADRATDSDAFQYTARAGFAASGVLHLLLGYIIGRLAFTGGGNADQSGALATLGSQTGGAISAPCAAMSSGSTVVAWAVIRSLTLAESAAVVSAARSDGRTSERTR